MRYIYFEVHRVYTPGEENKMDLVSKDIKNSNALLFAPDNLSSTGDWGFRTITKQGDRRIRHNDKVQRLECVLFIDQVWIDLDVYKEKDNDKPFDIYSKEDVKRVKFDLRFKKGIPAKPYTT